MIRAVFILVASDILDREFQYILIPYRIDNGVLVQTFAEQIPCGARLTELHIRIVAKYWRTREAKHLRLGKKLLDIRMRIAKLTAVTFIKDKHNFLVTQMRDFVQMLLFDNRIIEFLQCGDDEFRPLVIEFFDEVVRVGGLIHAAFGKGIELPRGLKVQILSIHDKQHLMHLGHILDNLTGFERSQGFTRSRGMPNIRIVIAGLHLLAHPLHRVELIRAQHLHDFLLGEHGVMRHHL